MKTITVQIGNSDDKLTQKEWSQFVSAVDMHVRAYSKVHFFGISPGNVEWQNACWVGEIEHEEYLPVLKRLVRNMGIEFRQDSIAWTEGETELI